MKIFEVVVEIVGSKFSKSDENSKSTSIINPKDMNHKKNTSSHIITKLLKINDREHFKV